MTLPSDPSRASDISTASDTWQADHATGKPQTVHATAISLLSTLSFVVRVPDIFEYKDKLVSLRKQLVPHLLPPLEEDYSPDIDPEAHIEAALIDLVKGVAAAREKPTIPQNSPVEARSSQ